MSALGNDVDLNDEQRAVVEAPIQTRLLVTAGAGQGKTEVVAARIGHLVETEDLSASTEVLVLSFSRAAVQAVRSRLDLRDVAQANVRTFDSLAGQLLIEAEIAPVGSFEARIRQATKYLVEVDEMPYDLESLRHIVMDEVQDLVGDRADFVIALLRKLDSGVGITALGDPLQGIYEFQLKESYSKTSSIEVFDALLADFGARRVGLGANYRARGEGPRRVLELGEQLRGEFNIAKAKALLDDFDAGLNDLGEIRDWADMLPRRGSRTAVLCATNGEVFRVSRHLSEVGVSHIVRRQAQDFGAAKWVALALGDLVGPVVARSVVEASLERAMGSDKAEDYWFLLKNAEGNIRKRNELNIARLRVLIRSGAIPLTLTEPDSSDVIVSTVHRAKGLEFDRVFLVNRGYVRKDEDQWSTVRSRYVGLSRARDELYVGSLPRAWGSFKSESWLPGRLLERVSTKTKTKRTRSVEFRYNDVDIEIPFSSDHLTAADAQASLQDEKIVGERLDAVLDVERSSSEAPCYSLMTEGGRFIGRTSDDFNEAFVKAFGIRGGVYPSSLTGLSVVSVETVAGDPRVSQRMDISFSGLWLAPRVIGLAQPDWSNMEDVS